MSIHMHLCIHVCVCMLASLSACKYVEEKCSKTSQTKPNQAKTRQRKCEYKNLLKCIQAQQIMNGKKMKMNKKKKKKKQQQKQKQKREKAEAEEVVKRKYSY